MLDAATAAALVTDQEAEGKGWKGEGREYRKEFLGGTVQEPWSETL